MAKRKKLYIVGIDAGVLWIISRLHKKYDMKGFDYFINEGGLREMPSTSPPVSSAAWPSIYTGKKPGEHGIMDFLHLDKNYDRQIIYYETQKHKPFWEVLAQKGIRSLCITPPMVLEKSSTHNVDLITGWPLSPSYNSKELESAAKKFGFKGEQDLGIDLDKQSIPLQKATKSYVESIQSRSEMAKYLIKKNDYDLVMVCYTETDRIIHYALNKKDWEKYVAPVYKSASDFLEWIVEYAKSEKDGASVMLFSDHGSQPVRNKFLTNTWLIDNGYASLRSSKPKPKKNGIGLKTKRYVSERIMKLKIRRAVYNKMPAFMKRSVEKMLDESLTTYPQVGEHIKIQESDLDMANTKVFSAVSYGPDGMMWINDSRFSKPGVKDSQTSRVKNEIIAKLKKLKTKDGKQLVLKIIDGKKYYKDAKSFIAPDILFELAPGNIVDFSYYSSNGIFMEPELARSGDHSQNGIFGWIGSGLKANKKGTTIYDIYPYIMKYFER
jgi:predicted AlkP superfamily phosphohydrolase/phosphomutase